LFGRISGRGEGLSGKGSVLGKVLRPHREAYMAVSQTISKRMRVVLWAMQRSTNRIICSIRGTLLGNLLSAYWYTGRINFGDLITPLLLARYGFTPIYSPIKQAKVLSTGSILEMAPEDYSGHIVGSGLNKDKVLHFRQATIWGVRGELTRQRIDAPKDVVLGDPGLLSSKLLEPRRTKRYVLGIVPHYADKKDARISMIQKRYKSCISVIDVQQKPLAVFKEIDECECILSSSLHGIIVADSFGIPNGWILLSDKVIGKGFKFYDYYSAIGISRDPQYLDGNESVSQLLKFSRKCPDAIKEVKERLDNMFWSLKKHFTME
jgi:pyruvyltransferase